MLDEDLLPGDDGGVLLSAATLPAGAECLLDPEPAGRSSPSGLMHHPVFPTGRRAGRGGRGRR